MDKGQRRGHYLEAQLDKLGKYLDSVGVHMHKNHARRTVDGVFVEGEPFDYEVFSGGVIHCFDAKECHDVNWSLANAKPLQVKHLLDCRKNGANAYFLVYFAPERKLKRFDVELIRAHLAEGKKSVTSSEGVDWDWTELNASRKNTAF